MRSREKILELLQSIVDNDEQYAADKVIDIKQLLEEEGND